MASCIVHKEKNWSVLSFQLTIQWHKYFMQNIPSHPWLWLTIVTTWKTLFPNTPETAGILGLPNHNRRRFRFSHSNDKECNGHPVFALLATFAHSFHLPQPFIWKRFPKTSSLINVPDIFRLLTLKYLWQSFLPRLICVTSNNSRLTRNRPLLDVVPHFPPV